MSTDTVFLGPRERLLTQGIHRGLGVAAIGFLVLHVTTKVVEARVTTPGAFLPLGVTGRDGLISLGVLAAYLMILAAATGAMRSVFAANRHPVRWRILHSTAYASWCMALIHGLQSGRSAKTWIIVAYGICLVGVAIGLIYRLRRTRGEALFPETRERSASYRKLGGERAASRGGSGRRRAVPREETGPSLASAYSEPLPPLPNFPTAQQYTAVPPRPRTVPSAWIPRPPRCNCRRCPPTPRRRTSSNRRCRTSSNPSRPAGTALPHGAPRCRTAGRARIRWEPTGSSRSPGSSPRPDPMKDNDERSRHTGPVTRPSLGGG